MATLCGISGRIKLSFSARRATQRPRAQPKRPSPGAVALATFGKRLGTSPALHMVPCAARWAAALLARPTVPIDRPLTGATSARARARQTLLPNLDDPARCEQRCRSMDALSPKGVAHTGQLVKGDLALFTESMQPRLTESLTCSQALRPPSPARGRRLDCPWRAGV